MTNFIKNLECKEDGFAIAVSFLFHLVVAKDLLLLAFQILEMSLERTRLKLKAAHIKKNLPSRRC